MAEGLCVNTKYNKKDAISHMIASFLIFFGEGMWESNPPGRLLIPYTDFEDQRAHQNPSTPKTLSILTEKIRFSYVFKHNLTNGWYNNIITNELEENKMIITTTPSVEGYKIVDYKGIVFGEVINGVDFIKDFAAGLTNFFGGRSGSYEGELIDARENALKEMASRAKAMGANAIIGVDIDYEVLGQANNMLMVTASGTAVIIE